MTVTFVNVTLFRNMRSGTFCFLYFDPDITLKSKLRVAFADENLLKAFLLHTCFGLVSTKYPINFYSSLVLHTNY